MRNLGRFTIAAAAAASFLVPLNATAADAAGVTPNQYVQVWSCAVNVPGGACYRWYQWLANPPYHAQYPSVVVKNQYVYDRYVL